MNEQMKLIPERLLQPEELKYLENLTFDGFTVVFGQGTVEIRPDTRVYCRGQIVADKTFEKAYARSRRMNYKRHDWEATFYDPCGRNEYRCKNCGMTR